MLKKIMSWFKEDIQDKAEIVEQDLSYQSSRLEELAKRKAEWETKNELAKKRDACNLYFTHTAFNGTYEEFLTKCTTPSRDYLAAMNANLAAQQMGNFYGMQNQAGISNGLGGMFG